ncbi:MAG: DUF3868 domain-containing protein [Alistipes sp.]
MKKTGIYIVALTALIGSTTLYAKQLPPAYNGIIQITADTMWQSWNNVNVEMSFNVVGKAVMPNQALVLTPVLHNERGSIDLPQIVVNGTKRAKAYRRSQEIHRGRYANPEQEPYVVLKAAKKTQAGVRYSVSFGYRPWMKNASLMLREELYGCAGRNKLISVRTLASLRAPHAPRVDTIILILRDTVREQPEIQKKEGAAYLDFPIGQSRILPDYSNNAAELKRVNVSLDSLWQNDKITITSIYLAGYASPDGSSTLNKKLSESRAQAFREYLKNRHGHTGGLYRVDGKGEDWAGLTQLIESSSMPWRDEVLGIIRNAPTDEARKSQLMKLDGGIPYKYMKTTFFPKLRKVEYKVFYMQTSVVPIE